MQTKIARVIASITEDRRSSYVWNTKIAAASLDIEPNRFGEWWQRTKSKLTALAIVQPGETAAELAALIATAMVERDRLEREGGDNATLNVQRSTLNIQRKTR
jgi:hypothetical protein